jgi:ADP-ribose pyrophosphatase
MYIYLATGLTPGDCKFDEDENIDIYHVDLEEVYNMISKNEIEDAKTSIGILLAKELI